MWPKFVPPNVSKLRFLTILLKRFLWIHTSLALNAHWSLYQRCWQYGLQRLNFGAILDPKGGKNSGLWSLSQMVLLVSHQYCFTCSLQVLLAVWRIWASEVKFLCHFGAPKWVKILVFGHFLKLFSIGFASVLVYMSIWAIFGGVLNIGLRGPIFPGHFGPQNKTWFRSSGFTSFLFYMLIGGMWRCISACSGDC